MPDLGSGRHAVHPRWAWATLAVALTGLAIVGIGVKRRSRRPPAHRVGRAMVVRHPGDPAGRPDGPGGPGGPGGLEAAVSTGQVQGDRIEDPEAKKEGARADRQRLAILARAQAAAPPSPAALGGWVLVLAALVLAGSQWTAYPTGRSSGLHLTYAAIVAGLAGLRVLTAPDRAHPVAAALGLLTALGLGLHAWLSTGTSTGVGIFETVVAVLVAAGSLACLLGGD